MSHDLYGGHRYLASPHNTSYIGPSLLLFGVITSGSRDRASRPFSPALVSIFDGLTARITASDILWEAKRRFCWLRRQKMMRRDIGGLCDDITPLAP